VAGFAIGAVMATLSSAAFRALTALADDDQAVITTVRRTTSVEWSARVKTRGDAYSTAARFALRTATFHCLHRSGLIAKACEWETFGLIYAEYVLTDAGQAALEAA
jgi:hypothetical protein